MSITEALRKNPIKPDGLKVHVGRTQLSILREEFNELKGHVNDLTSIVNELVERLKQLEKTSVKPRVNTVQEKREASKAGNKIVENSDNKEETKEEVKE